MWNFKLTPEQLAEVVQEKQQQFKNGKNKDFSNIAVAPFQGEVSKYDPAGYTEGVMENIEDWRARKQSVGDALVNSVVKNSLKFGTRVVDNLGFPIWGLLGGIKDREFQGIYNNPVSEYLRGVEEYFDKELPNYMTKEQQDSAVSKFFSTNGINSILDGLSYSVAAIVGFGLASKGLKVTFGALRNITKNAFLAPEIVVNALNAGKEAELLNLIKPGAISAQGEDIIKGVGASLYGATVEASAEASQTYKDLEKQWYDKIVSEKGYVDEEDKKLIHDKASLGANLNFGTNLAIITGSRFLQFGKLFRNEADDVIKVSGLVKNAAGEFEKKASKLDKWKKYSDVLLNAGEEGAEELSQTFSNAFLTSYFSPQDEKFQSFTKSFGDAVDVLKGNEGVESGLVGGAVGLISSLLTGGLGKRAKDRAREQEAIDLRNQAKISDNMVEMAKSLNRAIEHDNLAEESLKEGNHFMYHTYRDAGVFNTVKAAVDTDSFDALEADIEQEKAQTQDEFEQKFGFKKGSVEKDVFVDKLLQDARKVKQGYLETVRKHGSELTPAQLEVVALSKATVDSMQERESKVKKELKDLGFDYDAVVASKSKSNKGLKYLLTQKAKVLEDIEKLQKDVKSDSSLTGKLEEKFSEALNLDSIIHDNYNDVAANYVGATLQEVNRFKNTLGESEDRTGGKEITQKDLANLPETNRRRVQSLSKDLNRIQAAQAEFGQVYNDIVSKGENSKVLKALEESIKKDREDGFIKDSFTLWRTKENEAGEKEFIPTVLDKGLYSHTPKRLIGEKGNQQEIGYRRNLLNITDRRIKNGIPEVLISENGKQAEWKNVNYLRGLGIKKVENDNMSAEEVFYQKYSDRLITAYLPQLYTKKGDVYTKVGEPGFKTGFLKFNDANTLTLSVWNPETERFEEVKGTHIYNSKTKEYQQIGSAIFRIDSFDNKYVKIHSKDASEEALLVAYKSNWKKQLEAKIENLQKGKQEKTDVRHWSLDVLKTDLTKFINDLKEARDKGDIEGLLELRKKINNWEKDIQYREKLIQIYQDELSQGGKYQTISDLNSDFASRKQAIIENEGIAKWKEKVKNWRDANKALYQESKEVLGDIDELQSYLESGKLDTVEKIQDFLNAYIVEAEKLKKISSLRIIEVSSQNDEWWTDAFQWDLIKNEKDALDYMTQKAMGNEFEKEIEYDDKWENYNDNKPVTVEEVPTNEKLIPLFSHNGNLPFRKTTGQSNKIGDLSDENLPKLIFEKWLNSNPEITKYQVKIIHKNNVEEFNKTSGTNPVVINYKAESIEDEPFYTVLIKNGKPVKFNSLGEEKTDGKYLGYAVLSSLKLKTTGGEDKFRDIADISAEEINQAVEKEKQDREKWLKESNVVLPILDRTFGVAKFDNEAKSLEKVLPVRIEKADGADGKTYQNLGDSWLEVALGDAKLQSPQLAKIPSQTGRVYYVEKGGRVVPLSTRKLNDKEVDSIVNGIIRVSLNPDSKKLFMDSVKYYFRWGFLDKKGKGRNYQIWFSKDNQVINYGFEDYVSVPINQLEGQQLEEFKTFLKDLPVQVSNFNLLYSYGGQPVYINYFEKDGGISRKKYDKGYREFLLKDVLKTFLQPNDARLRNSQFENSYLRLGEQVANVVKQEEKTLSLDDFKPSLKAKEKLAKLKGKSSNDLETKKADIEKRRQEELPIINVYWDSAETTTNTRLLSNLAPRKFTYKGKEYGSVEHAYQTLKSGEFDQITYDKYVKAGGYGTKIRGKQVNKGFNNLQLMKDLVVESFKQNPEQAKLLLKYKDFTHTTNEIIDKAFLEGLKLAKYDAELAALESQSSENITEVSVDDIESLLSGSSPIDDNLGENFKFGAFMSPSETNVKEPSLGEGESIAVKDIREKYELTDKQAFVANKLLKNGAFGAFVSSSGKLNESYLVVTDKSPVFAAYHEEFHLVEQMFWDDAERLKLYDEVNKVTGQSLTQQQASEHLAEQYRYYVIHRRYNLLSKLNDFLKGAIKDLFDFINKILGIVESPDFITNQSDLIKKTFNDIYSGVYARQEVSAANREKTNKAFSSVLFQILGLFEQNDTAIAAGLKTGTKTGIRTLDFIGSGKKAEILTYIQKYYDSDLFTIFYSILDKNGWNVTQNDFKIWTNSTFKDITYELEEDKRLERGEEVDNRQSYVREDINNPRDSMSSRIKLLITSLNQEEDISTTLNKLFGIFSNAVSETDLRGRINKQIQEGSSLFTALYQRLKLDTNNLSLSEMIVRREFVKFFSQAKAQYDSWIVKEDGLATVNMNDVATGSALRQEINSIGKKVGFAENYDNLKSSFLIGKLSDKKMIELGINPSNKFTGLLLKDVFEGSARSEILKKSTGWIADYLKEEIKLRGLGENYTLTTSDGKNKFAIHRHSNLTREVVKYPGVSLQIVNSLKQDEENDSETETSDLDEFDLQVMKLDGLLKNRVPFVFSGSKSLQYDLKFQDSSQFNFVEGYEGVGVMEDTVIKAIEKHYFDLHQIHKKVNTPGEVVSQDALKFFTDKKYKDVRGLKLFTWLRDFQIGDTTLWHELSTRAENMSYSSAKDEFEALRSQIKKAVTAHFRQKTGALEEIAEQGNLKTERSKLLSAAMLYELGNFWQMYELLGSPFLYNDPLKRFPAAQSTKDTFDVSPEYISWFENFSKQTGTPVISSGVRTIVVNDIKEGNSNFTDAQGIISPVFYRFHRITEGTWNDRLDDLWKKGMSGTLTQKELKENLLIQAIKPQFFGSQTVNNEDYQEHNYDKVFYKTSVYPLFPQLTQDFPELEKLRKKMEKDDIHMTLFESAVKVGRKVVVGEDTLTWDGYVNQPVNEKLVQIIHLQDWGTQTYVDDKPHLTQIEASQPRKIIKGDLIKYKDEPLDYENPGITIGQALDELDAVAYEKIKLQDAELLKELGIQKQVTVEGDKFIINNVKKVREILTKQAKERDLGENIIQGLNQVISEHKGLDLIVGRDRIESLLLSMVRNQVLKSKRFGDSKVQISPAGFVSFDKNKGEITQSDDLRFYEKTINGKKIMAMQVYLPSYLKEDVNVEDLPEVLKTFIGFRIPTQSLASIEHIEVKGWINGTNGIVVPKKLPGKSGSDFDVDKLNLYFPEHYSFQGKNIYIETEDVEKAYRRYVSDSLKLPVKEEAGLIPIQSLSLSSQEVSGLTFEQFKIKSLNNRMLEIYKGIMSNPVSWGKLTTGIDDAEIKGIANDIRKLRSFLREDLLDFFYMIKKGVSFQAGKRILGQIALHNTHHVEAQLAGLKLSDEWITETEKLNPLSITGLGRFNRVEDIGGKKLVSLSIDQYVSAAVDVEKDDYIIDLNFTEELTPLGMSLLRQGIPLKTVNLLMTQPVMMEYSKRFAEATGVINGGDSISSVRRAIVKKLDETIIKNGTKKLTDIDLENQIKNDSLDTEVQRAVFDFLLNGKYNQFEVGRALNSLMQSSTFDTKGNAKSFTENDLIKQKFAKFSIEDNFLSKYENGSKIKTTGEILDSNSVNRLLYRNGNPTFLQGFKEVVEGSNDYFSSLYKVESDFKQVLNPILDYVYSQFKPTAEIVRTANLVKREFVTWLIQSLDLKGQKTQVQNKVIPALVTLKGSGNSLVDELVIDEVKKMVYLKDSSRMDSLRTQSVNEAFMDLWGKNPKLAEDFVKLILFQSGLKRSSLTLYDIIPNRILLEVIKKYFYTQPSSFTGQMEQFYLNLGLKNYKNTTLVPWNREGGSYQFFSKRKEGDKIFLLFNEEKYEITPSSDNDLTQVKLGESESRTSDKQEKKCFEL